MSNLKFNLSQLQEKAKQRTVKTQNIEYDLETLVKKIEKGIIKLNPDYQRKHRWENSISARLIESLILNIPIPTIYLSQDVDVDIDLNEEDARYSVIDGQQRLSAIYNFFKNTFALESLSSLKELEGCYYKDLPPFLVRRLEERTIKCLRIDSTVDPQVKYDIFERLNSGSVRLTAQELRNAVSRGRFNDLLKELSTDENFRALLRISSESPETNKKVKKMEDIELVLRFFVLSENLSNRYERLKKGFGQYLSDEMARIDELVEKMTQPQLVHFKNRFVHTMKYIRDIYGDFAFAKYAIDTSSGDLRKVSNFNAAVYDALTMALIARGGYHPPGSKQQSQIRFVELFKNESFFRAVSGSVNDREKLLARIDLAASVVQ